MDKEIEIKEDLLEDDTASQNEREFFHKIVTPNTNIDDITDCDMTVKTEIKLETPFTKDLVKQIISKTATWSNNYDINRKSEIGNKIEIKVEDLFEDNIASQNERDFFHKVVTTDTNIDDVTDCEITVKTEIKSETPVIKDVVQQINSETATWSNSCDINGKSEIEQQTLFSDIGSQNERDFFHKVITTDTNIDDVTDCELTVKTEIKSETPVIKDVVKQIKSETATWSNSCDINGKSEIEQQTLFSDIGSQNEGEFLLEDSVMIDKKFNSDHEIDNKIEIKEEPWWLQTETSSIGDNTKDAVLPPVKSSRLYPETVPAATLSKSPLVSAGVPARNTSFCNGIDHLEYDYQKCNVRCDVLTAKEYVHSKQYGKCDGAETYMEPLYLKQSSSSDMTKTTQQCSTCEKSFSSVMNLKKHTLVHDGKKSHQCKVCDKSFNQLISLKRHNLVHEGKKSHQCKVGNKRFTQLSTLKIHTLAHEGKKPYQCKVCDKSFNHLPNLKRHNLLHEGKKPHQCKVCNKRFTQLSTLKIHTLAHEGKKPHQCKVCNKSFTHLGNLKRHNLVHEGKKPHQCKVCDKRFTQSSNLKEHNLIHEGKKSHQCKVCDKMFTQLSNLKRHTLVHDVKKPHQCKVCDKSFSHLANLKRHNLVHEGKKAHQCKVCEKRFTQLSSLKIHTLVHEGKKPHQCKVCDKTFTQLSNLKRHSLVHEGKKEDTPM